eukprot:1149912-Pelagomonas_calceolata.AAC.5
MEDQGSGKVALPWRIKDRERLLPWRIKYLAAGLERSCICGKGQVEARGGKGGRCRSSGTNEHAAERFWGKGGVKESGRRDVRRGE